MLNTEMSTVKKTMVTACMTALCVVLPMAFHSIPNGGSIYCPMHFPVLLCGLLVSPAYGLICGLLGPLFSSILTGMPAAGYAPQMMVELGAYGLFAGLFMSIIKTKRTALDLYISLIGALLLGRVVVALFKVFFFARGRFTIAAFLTSYFVTCLPAIILQLIILPAIYMALAKAGFVGERYLEVRKEA